MFCIDQIVSASILLRSFREVTLYEPWIVFETHLDLGSRSKEILDQLINQNTILSYMRSFNNLPVPS
jgi:hypothetical protein